MGLDVVDIAVVGGAGPLTSAVAVAVALTLALGILACRLDCRNLLL